jgi:hypothetical protein
MIPPHFGGSKTRAEVNGNITTGSCGSSRHRLLLRKRMPRESLEQPP